MNREDRGQWLARLGSGETIASLCAVAGISRDEFDRGWQTECRQRVPAADGSRHVTGIGGRVQIERDRWGIPHVRAGSDRDLFVGFGYATAADRLFQLDYVRRRAQGRLAEILGPTAVESDVLYRTLGLGGIAQAEWSALRPDTQTLVEAYCVGVNALIEASRQNLPIEFALLDYEPEPWLPTDCLAIVGDFRWYLTGRLPVIVVPELARRQLGDGPLYRAFLSGEADEESILPPGSYRPGPPSDLVGTSTGSSDDGHGSNNWVLAGSRTASGKPLLACDPHIPFAAVSIWHEIVLSGDSLAVAGVALAGMPGVMVGRNRRVAWGLTNNICSLRDLYQERTSPEHSGSFYYDGRWEPSWQREEVIRVRGGGEVCKTVRGSRNGPIVNELLPPAARGTGPVALRWVGAEPCGWVTALVDMNRAGSCAEFREAIRPWRVPTFNLVFADVDGAIGMQTTGRIPIRRVSERGYRPGWDPRHQWDGYIPFEGLPHLMNPASGYAITANNRLAPDDYPYPLSGTWASGYRARRIREQIEAQARHEMADCQRLQYDVCSLRAAAAVRPLLAMLKGETDARTVRAAALLADWDFHVRTESVAAAIFNVFFQHWCCAVAAERFDPTAVELAAANAGGLALDLLTADPHGWFHRRERGQAIRDAFRAALDELTRRLGPEIGGWQWGRLHKLVEKHFLSSRGDLAQLLDRGGQPIIGDGHTVCGNAADADFAAYLGPGYRLLVDLSDPACGLSAMEIASTSGHPGSSHYDDQLELWHSGKYHRLSLAGDEPEARSTLSLLPSAG
jgi:penicillin amidase